MFEVRFLGTVGHFGSFPTQDKARAWAQLECDGRVFTIPTIVTPN